MVKDKFKKRRLEVFFSYFGFMGVIDCYIFFLYIDKDI